jgi:hypothetical protein
MRDQRVLAQDAVLRAQIATANKLIAEQSVAFARAHLAIERAIESLREPNGNVSNKRSERIIDRARPGRATVSKSKPNW